MRKSKDKEYKSEEEIEDEKLLKRVLFIYIPLFGIVFGTIFGLLMVY